MYLKSGPIKNLGLPLPNPFLQLFTFYLPFDSLLKLKKKIVCLCSVALNKQSDFVFSLQKVETKLVKMRWFKKLQKLRPKAILIHTAKDI
jgi:hypothetical protein